MIWASHTISTCNQQLGEHGYGIPALELLHMQYLVREANARGLTFTELHLLKYQTWSHQALVPLTMVGIAEAQHHNLYIWNLSTHCTIVFQEIDKSQHTMYCLKPENSHMYYMCRMLVGKDCKQCIDVIVCLSYYEYSDIITHAKLMMPSMHPIDMIVWFLQNTQIPGQSCAMPNMLGRMCHTYWECMDQHMISCKCCLGHTTGVVFFTVCNQYGYNQLVHIIPLYYIQVEPIKYPIHMYLGVYIACPNT